MINACKLTKRFGDITAIQGLTFEVEKGEILGFLGPNAAGKTTTMKVLTCYFPPSEGSASVAGFDVLEDSLEVRRRIGYLPENVPLYPEMTVRDYLEFCAAAKGIPHADREAALKRAVDRTHLGDVLHQTIRTISKGYRQRTGLAQAILNDPPVLILDEPTVGLDPAQIREVREVIRELGTRSTIILSSHILPEVSMTCSRVIILNRGRIRAMDTPANLTSRLQGKTVLRLQVQQAPLREVESLMNELKGIHNARLMESRDSVSTWRLDAEPDPAVRAELARAVVGRQWGLLELKVEQLSLEDIFLHVVREEEGGEAA